MAEVLFCNSNILCTWFDEHYKQQRFINEIPSNDDDVSTLYTQAPII